MAGTAPLIRTQPTTYLAPRQRNASQAFVNQAMKFMGQPYKWGGGHGNNTFGAPGPVDCSGLVTQAARMQGLKLSGTARQLRQQGRPVGLNELKPGDLVFRGTKHVGIYVGNGQVLHAPSRGKPVQLTGMKGWDAARRPFEGASAAPIPANQQAKAAKAEPKGGGVPADQKATAGGDRASDVALPQAQPATPAAAGSYTVKPGDSLSKIARRTLGDASRWPEIYAMNKDLIDNPDKIFPGQTFKLPGAEPAAATPSGANDSNSGQSSGRQNAPKAQEAAPVSSQNVGKFGGLLTKLENIGVSRAQLEAAAKRHGVPLNLALGVIQQESKGNPNARSPVGAQGLMQLMPATAREMGVTNPRDPHQNLEGGLKYLGQQLRRFGGDQTKALAAYNAGPGNVLKYGGVPPFQETREYVRKIQASMA